MKKYKRYFLTFSQGEWVDAGLRIESQVSKLNEFDEVISLTDKSNFLGLENLILENKKFIHDNPRGYGLWFWKPFICEALLNKINMGDVILYSDSGCEITNEGKFLINKILNYVNKNGSLFFSLPLTEKFWTKKELLRQFEKKDSDIGEKTQIQATFFVLRKDLKTIKMIKTWRRLSYIFSFHALKDSQQINSNLQHRNDQSVLSLIVKYYKMNIYPFDLHLPKEAYFKRSIALYLPIHPLRNKNKISAISNEEISNIIIRNFFICFFIIKKHISIYFSKYKKMRILIKLIRNFRNNSEI